MLVIILYCVFTFTSLALFPTYYSPLDNWLSDLGNSSYSPTGAVFYNIGCITTGIALVPFFIGLYKWYREEIWHKILVIIGQGIGIFSAIALILIGLYPEDFPYLHHLWSNIFFFAILFVLIITSVVLFLHESFKKPIGIYGIIVAILDFVFVFFGSPLLEWFVVFTALGYVGLIIYNMYDIDF
jgi:hypothetical membrane protein